MKRPSEEDANVRGPKRPQPPPDSPSTTAEPHCSLATAVDAAAPGVCVATHPHLDHLLERRGPFAPPDFSPVVYTRSYLPLCRVLVAGAGALGCEILKNLVLSGFVHIDILDMDTVELSNLNRQFLFQKTHIGMSKAIVAAAAFHRYPHVKISPHFCRLQDKDNVFYAQFHLVICGLDSVEARRWISAMLVSLVGVDAATHEPDPATMIPLIDGGTEGLKGQTRVIFPRKSACIDCALDLYPSAQSGGQSYPLCTLAATPRLPEHCVQWAYLLAWPDAHPETPFDPDNPAHLCWICDAAQARAAAYGISGVTPRFALGVVKNVIPAVASTNAIIAASCVMEALKLVTKVAANLADYCMVNGTDGFYAYSFALERNPACQVCTSALVRKVTSHPVALDATLGTWLEAFQERHHLKLENPVIRAADKTLYMAFPEALQELTRPHLQQCLSRLLEADPSRPRPHFVFISDASLSQVIQAEIIFIASV